MERHFLGQYDGLEETNEREVTQNNEGESFCAQYGSEKNKEGIETS